MELWDVLDGNGNQTGKVVERGMPMLQDEYHLVVQVWIVNDNGEFLISKRTQNKPYGGMWETTGGSAITGDDSITAALREVKEELGIALAFENAHFFKRFKRQHIDCPDFADVWVFTQNVNLDDVVFQADETCDAMWVRKDTIIQMITDKEFVIWGRESFSFLDEFFCFVNQVVDI